MTKARTLADNFAADINGITAGTGITGGGTSGTVTVTNSMATEIDAKGDLVVGTGADTFARLAVASTAGYLLAVDSTETTGLKWAAPAGGTTTWTAYTPTTANITVGNGSLTTEYFQQGTFVAVRFRFRLGSTSSIGNDSTISLPFAASDANRGVSGQVSFWDDNDNKVYDAVAFVSGTTNIIIYAANASSTYTFGSVISATVPFTWTTDDSITTQFVYESV